MKKNGLELDGQKSAATDWTRIHRRLESARKVLEEGASSSADAKRRILMDRAKALARAAERPEAVREWIDVVEFMLDGERYALEPRIIREIRPLKELTPLPGTPPFVLGIMNNRGQILSVIGLGRFFGVPEKSTTEPNRLVILKSGDMELGILVEEILGMRAVPREDLQLQRLQTGIPQHFIMGMAPDGLIVLNGEKILEDRRVVVEEAEEI